jgi:perosamine synthetase
VTQASPIPLARPLLGEEEERGVLDAMRSGWISQGPRSAAFERAVASYLDIPHARAVNSGTSAMQLALLACGVRPGDEVIVPAFTCVAALHPIEAIGGQILPVDIDLATYGLDPSHLESAITPATRAIVPAHLFGQAAQVEAIAVIANRHDLILIEDVALGMGARIRGRHVGTFGDAAILSFHPRKTITTGEGGMVLSPSAEIAGRVEAMRAYGASVPAWTRHNTAVDALPDYSSIGFNYKMTDIQAAIGLEQIRKLDAFLDARRAIAARYETGLADLPWLALPRCREGETHGYQSFVCQCVASSGDPARVAQFRDRLIAHLRADGIASVQAAQSVTSFDYYRRKYSWAPQRFPNAVLADAATISLPIFPGLAESDQDRIVMRVRQFGKSA